MKNTAVIHVQLWSDEKFSSLSKPAPNAQTLWLYILTGPHQSQVPGLSLFGPAAMAESLGWTPRDFGRCFQEILRQGLAKHDATTRLLWVPKAHQYNPPQSPMVTRRWRYGFDSLPQCHLKLEAFQVIKAFLEAYSKPFREPFGEPLGKPYREARSKARREALLSYSSLSFPEGFTLNPEREQVALRIGIPKEWVAHAWGEWETAMRARGTTYVDWDKAWANNCHRQLRFAPWRNAAASPSQAGQCKNYVLRDGRFMKPCGEPTEAGKNFCPSCSTAIKLPADRQREVTA